MSNSRRLRRSILEANGVAVLSGPDERPGSEHIYGTPPAGAINAYACRTCGKLTVVRHIDAGSTPDVLPCLTTFGCDGTSESIGYPDQNRIPDRVREAVRWEWYRPNRREFMKLDEETKQNVASGGLLLRERI